MNEFAAKKLGEVLAFAVVGIETLTKGRRALEKPLGEAEVDQLIAKNSKHRDMIIDMAEKAGVKDVVLSKLDSTGEKLRGMRDMYVGEEWDNPTELLEWSGFFEGAAIVHWNLVDGVGEVTENADLMDMTEDAVFMHKDFLEKVEECLNEVGKEKGI